MTASAGEQERFLRDFHDRKAGVTARAMARGWSYDAVVREVAGAARVLDLGCGDGHLLERLAEPGRRTFGVDLSRGEISVAAARGCRAVMQGRAHALPMRDACVDAVVSHLAFTLMHDPDGVVAEVARVLAGGGRFVAVVGGGPRGDAVGDAFTGMLELARPLMRSAAVPRLGDVRARSDAGLAALFAPARGWSSWRVDDLPIDLSGTPDEVWEVLAGSYELDGVDATSVAGLRARFVEVCNRWRRPDGAVACVLAARLVVATAVARE